MPSVRKSDHFRDNDTTKSLDITTKNQDSSNDKTAEENPGQFEPKTENSNDNVGNKLDTSNNEMSNSRMESANHNPDLEHSKTNEDEKREQKMSRSKEKEHKQNAAELMYKKDMNGNYDYSKYARKQHPYQRMNNMINGGQKPNQKNLSKPRPEKRDNAKSANLLNAAKVSENSEEQEKSVSPQISQNGHSSPDYMKTNSAKKLQTQSQNKPETHSKRESSVKPYGIKPKEPQRNNFMDSKPAAVSNNARNSKDKTANQNAAKSNQSNSRKTNQLSNENQTEENGNQLTERENYFGLDDDWEKAFLQEDKPKKEREKSNAEPKGEQTNLPELGKDDNHETVNGEDTNKDLRPDNRDENQTDNQKKDNKLQNPVSDFNNLRKSQNVPENPDNNLDRRHKPGSKVGAANPTANKIKPGKPGLEKPKSAKPIQADSGKMGKINDNLNRESSNLSPLVVIEPKNEEIQATENKDLTEPKNQKINSRAKAKRMQLHARVNLEGGNADQLGPKNSREPRNSMAKQAVMNKAAKSQDQRQKQNEVMDEENAKQNKLRSSEISESKIDEEPNAPKVEEAETSNEQQNGKNEDVDIENIEDRPNSKSPTDMKTPIVSQKRTSKINDNDNKRHGPMRPNPGNKGPALSKSQGPTRTNALKNSSFKKEKTLQPRDDFSKDYEDQMVEQDKNADGVNEQLEQNPTSENSQKDNEPELNKSMNRSIGLNSKQRKKQEKKANEKSERPTKIGKKGRLTRNESVKKSKEPESQETESEPKDFEVSGGDLNHDVLAGADEALKKATEEEENGQNSDPENEPNQNGETNNLDQSQNLSRDPPRDQTSKSRDQTSKSRDQKDGKNDQSIDDLIEGSKDHPGNSAVASTRPESDHPGNVNPNDPVESSNGIPDVANQIYGAFHTFKPEDQDRDFSESRVSEEGDGQGDGGKSAKRDSKSKKRDKKWLMSKGMAKPIPQSHRYASTRYVQEVGKIRLDGEPNSEDEQLEKIDETEGQNDDEANKEIEEAQIEEKPKLDAFGRPIRTKSAIMRAKDVIDKKDLTESTENLLKALCEDAIEELLKNAQQEEEENSRMIKSPTDTIDMVAIENKHDEEQIKQLRRKRKEEEYIPKRYTFATFRNCPCSLCTRKKPKKIKYLTNKSKQKPKKPEPEVKTEEETGEPESCEQVTEPEQPTLAEVAAEELLQSSEAHPINSQEPIETCASGMVVQRIIEMSASLPTSQLLWRITDVKSKIKQAKGEQTVTIYSQHFYTAPHGYKMICATCPYGNRTGRRLEYIPKIVSS